MSNKLYELRQAVGRLMGSGDIAMVTGVPGAAFTNSSFQCESLALEEDDYYLDWWGRFYSGTHANTNFRVTGFIQSGGVVTFSPPLSWPVDASDFFELHRDFSPDEINNAVNLAIQMVEMEALEDRTDESLIVIANTWEYILPPGFAYLDSIYQVSDKDLANVTRIDSRCWQVINKSGMKYLWFDRNKVTLNEGYILRIAGQVKASQLTYDSDITAISPAYLVQQAKALLHQQRIDGTGGISERHDVQMKLAQAMADRERSKVFVIPRGWKV